MLFRSPIQAPRCPVYQNVSARAETDPARIKANLLRQLTAPVRWTACVQQMLADGATRFLEIGPGAVLQGLVGRIVAERTSSASPEKPEIAIEGIQ